MTRTKSTYLALVAVLLSPMAANADMISVEYDGTIFSTFSGFPAPLTFGVGLVYEADNIVFQTANLIRYSLTSASAIINGVEYGLATSGGYAQLQDQVGFVPPRDRASFVVGGLNIAVGGVTISALVLNLEGPDSIFSSSTWPTLLNVSDFSITQFGSVVFSGGTCPSTCSVSAGFDPYNNFPSLNNVSVSAVSVPEPGTLALLGIGLFGMGLARRKKV
jgi:hypothetical protein